MIKYIIPIMVLLIICIISFYFTISINPKINNYITNKINKLSFISYFKFRIKYPIVSNHKLPPIYIFYHVGINESLLRLKNVDSNKAKYVNLINDQLNKIIYSGLYAKCDAIYYGCNGLNSDIILKDFFSDYKKFIPLEGAISPNTKTYENNTINAMIKFSKNSADIFYGLYIHTKGITHPKKTKGRWRNHMEHWLVNNHNICIDSLNRGFNTVGTGLLYRHPIWTIDGLKNLCLIGVKKQDKAYCGNFFWFNSNYLKKCDYILNINHRFNAEFFLFKKYKKNKHINLDTVRYDYLGIFCDQRYYPFPINEEIKIGIY